MSTIDRNSSSRDERLHERGVDNHAKSEHGDLARAQARIKELERQLAEAKDSRDGFACDLDASEARLRASEAAQARYRAALKKYGAHDEDCLSRTHGDCTCGLFDALSSGPCSTCGGAGEVRDPKWERGPEKKVVVALKELADE